MIASIRIRRPRWTIEEVPSETGKRLAALALVMGDEHFPYLEYPDTRKLSGCLLSAVDGGSGCEISIHDEKITVTPIESGVRITCSASYDLTIEEAKILASDLIKPLAQTLTGTD